MKEKSNKPTPIFSYLLSLVTIISMAVAIYLYIYTRQLHRELAVQQATVAPTGSDSLTRLVSQLIEVDNQLFSGRYDEAMDGYRVLSEETGSVLPKSVILARIAWLKNRTVPLVDTVHAKTDTLTNTFARDSAITTRQEIAQLRFAYTRSTDSLRRLVDQLNRQVHIRSKALEQKDQIQHKEIKNSEGATIHFLGQLSDGRANGTGTGIWQKSGGVYKGDWKDNQRHGNGIYTWADGEKYEGTFTHDRREGRGIYMWPSGERYEGLWKDNRRHGQGTLYDVDGNISYEGVWENDKPKKK